MLEERDLLHGAFACAFALVEPKGDALAGAVDDGAIEFAEFVDKEYHHVAGRQVVPAGDGGAARRNID